VLASEHAEKRFVGWLDSVHHFFLTRSFKKREVVDVVEPGKSGINDHVQFFPLKGWFDCGESRRLG
jgi:hypothetical protein